MIDKELKIWAAEIRNRLTATTGVNVLPDWEKRYVILPGETPFWEIEDWKERQKANKRQRQRMWCLEHPRYNAEGHRISRKRYPGAAARALREWRKSHPEIAEKRSSTHVGVKKLFAPYKRARSEVCELCGCLLSLHGTGADYHHWNDLNPSAGLWTCSYCHMFAEVVDNGGWRLVMKYVDHKKELDEKYADRELVKSSRIVRRYRYVSTRINGVRMNCLAWGKRDRPSDNLCELCSGSKYSAYHHWDSAILGKGLWVCGKCHKFAGRFDTYGQTLVEKYLHLKEQDELRVLALVKASSAGITPSMLPSLEQP